jgi:hypothetical protein
MLLALVPEDRFAGHDGLLDLVWSTHHPRAFQDGENLRVGRRMPTQSATGRHPEDRRLDE